MSRFCCHSQQRNVNKCTSAHVPCKLFAAHDKYAGCRDRGEKKDLLRTPAHFNPLVSSKMPLVKGRAEWQRSVRTSEVEAVEAEAAGDYLRDAHVRDLGAAPHLERPQLGTASGHRCEAPVAEPQAAAQADPLYSRAHPRGVPAQQAEQRAQPWARHGMESPSVGTQQDDEIIELLPTMRQ